MLLDKMMIIKMLVIVIAIAQVAAVATSLDETIIIKPLVCYFCSVKHADDPHSYCSGLSGPLIRAYAL